MKTISLFWWHWGEPNLGDVASKYIVEKLSVQKVKNQGFPLMGELKSFIIQILKLRFPTNTERIVESLHNSNEYIVGLGSIIQHSTKNAKVWGSGFQNPKDTFKGGKLLAVRGPETNQELIKRGYGPVPVYGDPGLLMPLIYRPKVQKKYDVGIIPHIKEKEYIQSKIVGEGIRIIKLQTNDVEHTIQDILECKVVLSSSLHGLIFSQAYGIPAVLFRSFHTSEWQFKNIDYLKSVGLSHYNPICFDSLQYITKATLIDAINKYSKFSMIATSLVDMQRDLLSVAPFELKKRFIAEALEKQFEEEIIYIENNKNRI